MNTCIKILFIGFLFFISHVLFAYEKDLEPILTTSPNIDAMEYVLITHNTLSNTLQYLKSVQKKIQASDDTELVKSIRLIHIQYLFAFAYLYHESSISKRNRRDSILSIVAGIKSEGEKILQAYPNYSDLRWVVAASMFLPANTGIAGLNVFTGYRLGAIRYAEESVQLNTDNPMARVVMSNFDSLAPAVVGANATRGYNLITKKVNLQWEKPYLFEFYISRIHAYMKKRDFAKAKVSFANAKKLYPKSWRLEEFEDALSRR